jgi:transcription antitermination factor NusG
MMQKNWLAIYTKSRAEKKVEERLLKNGFEAYCPTYTTLKQWSDRKKKVELPLIPSYVFVHVDERERNQVLQDPGAMNFIFWQGKPAVIRQEEIEALKSTMSDVEISEAQVGEHLLVEHGAFKGQEGKIKHISGNSVVLVLESLNMTIRLKR